MERKYSSPGQARAILLIAGVGFAVMVLTAIWWFRSGSKVAAKNAIPSTKSTEAIQSSVVPDARRPRNVYRDVPALRSSEVQFMGESADPRINALIQSHNTRVLKVARVEFSGKCIWFGSSVGRPIHISFDIASNIGAIQCGQNLCDIENGVLHLEENSAMHIDALYVLLFRRFDPAQFTASVEETIQQADRSIECVRVDSPDESVWFSKPDGVAIRLHERFAVGDVVLDYQGAQPWPAAMVPFQIVVQVPPKMFGFNIGSHPPQIRLEVDPVTVDVVPSG